MTDVFVIGGARTPMTEYNGVLKDVSALELGAIAARAAFERLAAPGKRGKVVLRVVEPGSG